MRLFKRIIKLFGFAFILYLIYYVGNSGDVLFLGFFSFPKEPIFGLLHVDSLIFVMGALLGITFAIFNVNSLLFTIKIVLFINVNTVNKKLNHLRNNMNIIIDKYYESGIDSIVASDLKKFPMVYQALIKQLQMRIPIVDIVKIIDRRKNNYLSKVEDAIFILTTLASIGPSIGVMGTVIGLINLLGNLKDPSTIGPNMSVALMTTLYGLFFSNLVFSPFRRILIEFDNYNREIYKDVEFFLEIIKNNNPSFYTTQDYYAYEKTKKK